MNEILGPIGGSLGILLALLTIYDRAAGPYSKLKDRVRDLEETAASLRRHEGNHQEQLNQGFMERKEMAGKIDGLEKEMAVLTYRCRNLNGIH